MSYAEDISELNFSVRECKSGHFYKGDFVFLQVGVFSFSFFLFGWCFVFVVADLFQVWGESWNLD